MSEFRRAHRPADRRLVAGVSTGVAEHLGVGVLAVRIAFIVGTWFNGAGVIAYLLLWRFLPLQQPEMSPGLESATRRGLRTSTRPASTEVVQGVALAAIGVGVLVLLQATGRGPDGSLLAPVLVAVLGIAVIWRQFDDASLGRWMRQTAGVAFAARVGVGIVLVALAATYVITQDRGWGAVLDLGSAVVIALLGVALILGPWLYKLMGDLSDERRERMRSQERADVAAHLHDSVLQTLALLQKNPADAAQVATLARRQERELRAWLYGTDETIGDRFAASLRGVAAEVENSHGVAIETVVVGDAPMGSAVTALVRAAREAMVNASTHARIDRIDVYAEADGRTASVFVRDRGVGFDAAQIAKDRMGVRRSIVDRVERHGGTATIRTAPGEGTEVRLSAPVSGRANAPTDEPLQESTP
ncbi:MAG: PspC domain-containing protein [Aeromicrobium sp.]|uniref:ATP-binding protein n=1 Tax=Aeromicrobium sp. TaxID=1871063 RepID=UPI003C58A82C